MKYHYLLIKMCVISGKKYLCKKIAKSDAQAIKYTGSGKIVIRLKKKYGNSCMHHVSILAKFPEDQLEEFSETCKSYSKQFNVVESVDWLNLIEENGYQGGSTSEGNYTSGLKWMFKEDSLKRVKQCDIPSYLEAGWQIGLPDWYRQRVSESMRKRELVPWNKGVRMKPGEDYKTEGKYQIKTEEEKFNNRSAARRKLCGDPSYIAKFKRPRKPLLKLKNITTNEVIEIGREQAKEKYKLHDMHIKALLSGQVVKDLIHL